MLERRSHTGGATASAELVPGFTFSTCAYALHVLHERVADAIGLDVDLLESPDATVLLPDGTVARRDESGARLLGVLDGWRAWDAAWKDAARLVDATLLGPPPRWDELAAASELGRVSLDALLERHFGSEDAGLLFSRPYFEADPDEAGGPLADAWIETSRLRDARYQGVPRGGMGQVARAFADAAGRAGAIVHNDVTVSDVEPGVVTTSDGQRVRARAILVNAAPDDVKPSGARAAKIHCALSGPPDLSRLRLEPEQVGIVHVRDGSGGLVELQLPSLRDASLAPRDAHTLSIFVPNSEVGVDARRQATLAEAAIAAAERAIPNLRSILRAVVADGPRDLERRVGVSNGHIHHVPHAPASMFDRRGGARTRLDGVYRCGASAHPGGEVSGVPGWNAAQAVLDDLA